MKNSWIWSGERWRNVNVETLMAAVVKLRISSQRYFKRVPYEEFVHKTGTCWQPDRASFKRAIWTTSWLIFCKCLKHKLFSILWSKKELRLSLKWLITICIMYSGKEAPTKLVCSLIFSRGRLMRASSVPHPWS